MESINEKFRELYISKYDGIEQMRTFAKENEIYGPLLMACQDDLYTNEKTHYKILFIGQEAGFYPDKEVKTNINEIMKEYEVFNMGLPLNNKPSKRHTPFWKAVFSLNKILNPDMASLPCFLWSNVTKYSDGGEPIPDSIYVEYEKAIKQNLNILSDEINIAKPDVIVFLSGPNGYDEKIKIQFDGEIQFDQVQDDIPVREFARLIHKNLPEHTYRTYHPGAHSNESMKEKATVGYIDLIGLCVKGNYKPNLISNFKTQVREIATELGLILTWGKEPWGLAESEFYFTKPEWKYTSIGFGFDKSWAKDFFYGICRKEKGVEFTSEMENEILNIMGVNDGTNKMWLWWKFHEHENWDLQTFTEIGDNKTLKEKIKQIVFNSLEKLKSVEHEL
ncbi:MAG: hypothetical protein IPN61_18190 [Bacteroidetes bacterium]|nr:hypothetical protein [Bacteroidota bacterium]